MATGKDKDKKKIIIVKKKGGHHGGHHGGSWKVAYADFVTAMMAFFMVMWILGMSEQLKANIEGYFQNPVGYKNQAASGASVVGMNNPRPNPKTVQQLAKMLREAERKQFEQIGERIKMIVMSSPALKDYGAQIEITVGTEGLRIELVDAGGGHDFFQRGSAVMQPVTRAALKLIASELGPLKNTIVLEGHTDASRYGSSAAYTNWELSADRGNAARRELIENGIFETRVREVRGYADRMLHNRQDPFAAANRRVSILVPYSSPTPAGDSTAARAKDSVVPELPGTTTKSAPVH